jgi:hypothetical protein
MAPADTIIAVINRLSERSFVMFLAPQKNCPEDSWRAEYPKNWERFPKISEKLITFPITMLDNTVMAESGLGGPYWFCATTNCMIAEMLPTGSSLE